MRKYSNGAVDKATSTIYALHPAPEIFATEIAKNSLSSVFGVLVTEEVLNGDETRTDAFLSSLSPSKLGRFLFVISHIALNHLVYNKTYVRKIQKQKRENESCQPITEGPQSDASKSLEVILAFAKSLFMMSRAGSLAMPPLRAPRPSANKLRHRTSNKKTKRVQVLLEN